MEWSGVESSNVDFRVKVCRFAEAACEQQEWQLLMTAATPITDARTGMLALPSIRSRDGAAVPTHVLSRVR